MSEPYQKELQVAVDAVRAAARVCRTVQSKITPDVLQKKDKSPVTVADFASQALICRALGAAFPHDPIIDEEDASELRTGENASFLDRICEEVAASGVQASQSEVCDWIDHNAAAEYSERFWTLDPIDGTKGFLRGEQYAVSLALIVNGRIELGLLGCPNLPLDAASPKQVGSIFHAVRGQGAWQRSLDGGEPPAPIQVSAVGDPSQTRLCESVEAGHSAHDLSAQAASRLGITRPAVRLDSQAKYAVVARGDAEIYMRLPTRAGYCEKIWDHAGGVLLVEEAGGRVSDIAGKPLEWRHGRELSANRGLVVSNGLWHDRVLAAIRESGISLEVPS